MRHFVLACGRPFALGPKERLGVQRVARDVEPLDMLAWRTAQEQPGAVERRGEQGAHGLIRAVVIVLRRLGVLEGDLVGDRGDALVDAEFADIGREVGEGPLVVLVD